METQAEVIARLKRIFDYFLDENFVSTNSDYFEKLITHLSGNAYTFVLQTPFALEWVDKCLSLINEDYNRINPKVISFMFNFCSILTLNEWIAIEIRERKILYRIQVIVNRDMHLFNPSVKLGIIRLFKAVARYSLGLAAMRTTMPWRFLIEHCSKDDTLYVKREARSLLYELIYKFSVKTHDEQIVSEILEILVKPIRENAYICRKGVIHVNVDDLESQRKLASSLELLSYILQQTVESEEKTNIVKLLGGHDFELLIWRQVTMTHNADFLEKLLTTLSSFNFARLIYDEWVSGQIPPERFNKFGVSFFNMMKFCLGRRNCEVFMKLAELNHLLWKKLGTRAPKEIQIENERVRFENQLIIFHVMPIGNIVKTKEFHKEEHFDGFMTKVFDLTCDVTMRITYIYREALYANNTFYLPADLAYKAIHSILSMLNILEREQAVLVFQTLTYAAKEFLLDLQRKKDAINGKNGSELTPLIVEIPNVLHALLVGLYTLIEHYNISWKDSIETTCLVNFAEVILEQPNLSTQLVVQALKVVQISIEHFLSPNMALLVDSLTGSGLVCLGPIIVKRFHDPAWEVRDSTLELVISIVSISRIKYPAFQKFLSDHNLCTLVYQMAQHDCEPYVRVSALKCLAQFVAISTIWENELSQLNIIEHILFVLYNDSEGIVRKEAVCTLSTIHKLRKIPAKYHNTVYSTLVHCAVIDLHWEVKVSALNFWLQEIKKQFSDQGMIDGTFPTVTFSKEKKKIVTLTAKEIHLSIVKIMNELSRRGCLSVILQCLADDCDAEVMKVTVDMVRQLNIKLNLYDYETLMDSIQDMPEVSMMESTTADAELQVDNEIESIDIKPFETSGSNANPDEVIEDILSSQDINYLIKACEQQLRLRGDELDERKQIDSDLYKKYANVSAKEFLTTIKEIDLDELLRKQQEWFIDTDSLGSLLDDILTTLAPENENISADCY